MPGIKSIRPMLTLLLLAVAAGCQSGGGGTIRAEAINPIATTVLDRHDSLVRGTIRAEDLSDVEKETFLRSSQIMRETLEAASPTATPK